MRTLCIARALLISLVAVQMVLSDPKPQSTRPRFIDGPPFLLPRRPGGGGPRPQPSFGPGGIRRPRPILRNLSEQPDKKELHQDIGQLPLNPRPNFDTTDFDFNGPDHEEDLEGGFVPVIPSEVDEEEEEDFENEPFVGLPPQSEEHTSPVPTISLSTLAPQRHSIESHADDFTFSPDDIPSQNREEPSFPSEPLFTNTGSSTFNQGLSEQQTQEIEFLSAPPPTTIRKRNTARPRRPTHPNQIPVYHEIYNQNGELVQEGEEGKEEEEEEPDRLAILLLDSKFSCVDKNNGYYADEDVNCEVFHYCQDTVKHSWLCPEGASFHQVHLICMPRSEDNICERSSTFHFVNDFLYRELDGPNKTYADRYYPEGFARGSSVNLQGALPANEYQAVQQEPRFPVTQKTRRPVVQDLGPPVYHPVNEEQHTGQSFQPSQAINDRVQPGLPEFQSEDHFSGSIGQHTSSPFEPTHDFGDGQRPFSSFHSPEEVRVQRPPPRPQFRPGRRPGNFNRHPIQIG